MKPAVLLSSSLPWWVGLAAAVTLHGVLGVAILHRGFRTEAELLQGSFVVELADVATSRGQVPQDVALGASAREQAAVAKANTNPPHEVTPLQQPAPEAMEEAKTLPTMPAPNPAQEAVAKDADTHADSSLLAAVDRAKVQAVDRKAPAPQEVAAWMQSIEIALQKNKTYPKAARKDKAQGVVTLRLTLGGDGEFIAVEMVESSGWPALDNAALDLVRTAGPYPTPPTIGADGTLRLLIPVSFALK